MLFPPDHDRLRLCLWYWGRHGGGAHYTLRLAEALAARDDVALSLSLSAGNELVEAFRRLPCPRQEIVTYGGAVSCVARSLLLPQTLVRFYRFLRCQRVDVVDSTMGHLWTRAALPAVRAAGARLLATVHDATLHPGEEGLLKTALYRPPPDAAGYVALTPFVARRLTEVWKIPPERISVVPLGVLDYGQRHGGAVAESPPPGAALRLLFLGRILPYKGLGLLAETMAVLARRGVPVSLKVAGAGDLDSAGGSALRHLPNVRIENRWIGDEEIPPLLATADAVVLPYTEASQSGIIPTAFAAAVPAVVTPVGGLVDQVRDGVDGLVAATCTAADVAGAVERLATDADLRRRLGAAAAERATADLDWRWIAEALVTAARDAVVRVRRA